VFVYPTSCCKHLDGGPDDTQWHINTPRLPRQSTLTCRMPSTASPWVRPNFPYITDWLVWNMRRNRSEHLAHMASGVPWWPVGDSMACNADTTTLCLSPAKTVRPPWYGHCLIGFSGYTSAYGEHPATSLADLILGHTAPARCQPRGH
jgi:hypothetical protein